MTVHAMPGLAVVAALARQAGSAVISKMCQRRQINNKAGGCPLNPRGGAAKELGLSQYKALPQDKCRRK